MHAKVAELFAVSPHYFLLPDGDGNDSSYDSGESSEECSDCEWDESAPEDEGEGR